MPLAPKTLFGLRGALESARGTDLTPTRILYPTDVKPKRGVGSIVISPLRNSYRPNRAIYPGLDVTTLSVEGPALFDELAFWLSLSVKGGLTGTGASADKTWAFSPANAADDLKSATLQWGVPSSATIWKLNYLMATGLTLTWKTDQAVTYATAVGIDVARPNPVGWELSLTRLFNTNTERTAYYAKTERKIRIVATGPALGGSNYKLQLDTWGVIDNVEEADVDGVGAEKITLIPLEDTAKDYEISLVNSLASIT